MHTHTCGRALYANFAHATKCMLLVCSTHVFRDSSWVPWWLHPSCWSLAALVHSSWRKDCTCQSVNTTLLQPCMPHWCKAPRLPTYDSAAAALVRSTVSSRCRAYTCAALCTVTWTRTFGNMPLCCISLANVHRAKLTFLPVTKVTSPNRSQPVKAAPRCTLNYR